MASTKPARLAIIPLLFLLAAPSLAQSVEAITRPSEDVTLSFVRPGRIAAILVKEGDVVTVDQILVKQDDAAELIQLEQLNAEADSELQIKAAQASLEQKRVEYAKMKDAGEKGAVPSWDVDRARLAVDIADLSLELARFEHAQAVRKRDEFKRQVERMAIRSPIAGKVEKLLVQPGEAADALEDVVRVVKTDPLWIDVPVPLTAARSLKPGQIASVSFAPGDKPRTATLIHVAAVADAASDTLTCRLQLPNPDERPAGEHVTVSFNTGATRNP